MDEEAVGATDNIVTEFATYEDFLDSQITPLDLFYLEVIFILCFRAQKTSKFSSKTLARRSNKFDQAKKLLVHWFCCQISLQVGLCN